MNKIYYLKTCDTCKKILKQINNLDRFTLQDLKLDPLTEVQLAELYKHTNSYEALVNKRAQLYKEKKLKEQKLSEADFKSLLLEHYTFLARPVVLYKNEIFIGNATKTTEKMLQTVN